MKRSTIALLLTGLILATVSFGHAQSIAYALPVKGPAVVVVPQRLGTLHRIPVLGDVHVAALPGFTASNTAPALGVALYREFPAGPDLNLQLGAHFVAVQGVPSSFGLYLGFGWRLEGAR